jgi:hypothetical protein
VPERQLAFTQGLGGIQQCFADVFWRRVRVLGKDLTGRHVVRDHRDYRDDGGMRKPLMDGEAAHDLWGRW